MDVRSFALKTLSHWRQRALPSPMGTVQALSVSVDGIVGLRALTVPLAPPPLAPLPTPSLRVRNVPCSRSATN